MALDNRPQRNTTRPAIPGAQNVDATRAVDYTGATNSATGRPAIPINEMFTNAGYPHGSLMPPNTPIGGFQRRVLGEHNETGN